MQANRQAPLAALLAGIATAASAAAPEKLKEAVDTATDAYIYGYSRVTTDVTRIQMSNVPKLEELKGPPNRFFNVKRYPPADYRGVSAPNADTLYSLAWVDLNEPQVFSYPDMGERYFLFPMYDLWMNDFDSPGSRTTGEKAGNFLTGPEWKGEVPKGMTHIAAKTRHMLILGRTCANGSEADYKMVNALQAQYKITPLASWGKPYTPVAPPVNPNPGISMTDKPQAVILTIGTESNFNWMTKLMCKDAPPAAADAPMLAKMATLGIEPCKPFELSKLDPGVQAALKDLPKMALKRTADNQASLGEKIAGWQITKGLGVYGTESMKRAVVAAFGWPANVQEDAVYPYTAVDSNGETLTGTNNYTITFAKGQTPPVDGFWSFRMFMIDKGWWFVPNKLNKFTVSMRDKPKFNDDGSLTQYFQNQSPGEDKVPPYSPTRWCSSILGQPVPAIDTVLRSMI